LYSKSLYSTFCTAHFVQHILYSTFCTARFIQYILYSTFCTARFVQYILYSTFCTACFVQHILYSTFCTAHFVQHVLYSTFCTVHFEQYILYSTFCTARFKTLTWKHVKIQAVQYVSAHAQALDNIHYHILWSTFRCMLTVAYHVTAPWRRACTKVSYDMLLQIKTKAYSFPSTFRCKPITTNIHKNKTTNCCFFYFLRFLINLTSISQQNS
jgi:hypothetical protein